MIHSELLDLAVKLAAAQPQPSVRREKPADVARKEAWRAESVSAAAAAMQASELAMRNAEQLHAANALVHLVTAALAHVGLYLPGEVIAGKPTRLSRKGGTAAGALDRVLIVWPKEPSDAYLTSVRVYGRWCYSPDVRVRYTLVTAGGATFPGSDVGRVLAELVPRLVRTATALAVVARTSKTVRSVSDA